MCDKTITICNIMGVDKYNSITGIKYSKSKITFSNESTIENIIQLFLDSLTGNDNVFIAISTIISDENQKILIDYEKPKKTDLSENNLTKISSNKKLNITQNSVKKIKPYIEKSALGEKQNIYFENNISIGNGRTAYLIASIQDYEKLLQNVIEAYDSNNTSLIFQIFITDPKKTKYKRPEPVITFCDFLLHEQKKAVDSVGKYLGGKYIMNSKNKISSFINDLILRNIINPHELVIFLQIDMRNFCEEFTDLLSFCGLLKKTAIFYDAFENPGKIIIKNKYKFPQPSIKITDLSQLLEKDHKFTNNPYQSLLPIIREKRSTKNIRQRAKSTMKNTNNFIDFNTVNCEGISTFSRNYSMHEVTPKKINTYKPLFANNKGPLLDKLIKESKTRLTREKNRSQIQYAEYFEKQKMPEEKHRNRHKIVFDYLTKNSHLSNIRTKENDKIVRKKQDDSIISAYEDKIEKDIKNSKISVKSILATTKYRLRNVYKMQKSDIEKYVNSNNNSGFL